MAKRSGQLAFPLSPSPRWGGRREGAGRKAGPRPRIPRRRRLALAARFPALVTLKVQNDVPSLRTGRFVRELESSLRAACEREGFRVVHYTIQADHLHAIVEAASAATLARGMKSLGSRLARAANRVFARRGPVLADRFHLRLLRTPREVRNAIAYVLLNTRRHAAKAGRLQRGPASIDPASSGRGFDGWRVRPLRTARKEPPRHPPVAPPHTWLLRIGWRRHGLIDPSEVPGGRPPLARSS